MVPDASLVVDDLAQKVRDAAAASRRLRIAGGASKDFLGYPDADADPLDVTAHRGVISYEPAELVMRVRAGTALAEVRDILAGEGQMLGFEPPDFDGNATMGGVI
ncbi:MAG: FAD-binding protein, partial [Pseudomonadales bacterium]|nr:FAD-binding protein [Pseudomonadales bacterium]